MKYCVHCGLNLTEIQLDDETQCPNCSSEVRVIKSKSLIDLMSELNEVMYNLESSKLKSNPKSLIDMAKIIERGERKLKREYQKRIESIKEIHYELESIHKFSDRLGYTMEG